MKILLVNIYYYPNMMGGAEHSVKLLAEGLASEGNDVAVATLDGSDKSEELRPQSINGVRIYRGYCKSIYRRGIKKNKQYKIDKIKNGLLSIYNPNANSFLKRAIDDFKPDIVHTNNLVTMSYGIWDYCRRKNIGLVHTLRDYWLIDYTTCIGGANLRIAKVFQFVMRRKSNRFTGIVVSPSKSTLEVFDSYKYFLNSEKYCIVNCIEFDDKQLLKCLSRKQKLSDEKYVAFLYAGSLGLNKGVRELIAEFKRCKMDNITLTICGDGDLRSEVEQVAKVDRRIRYKGKLDSNQMRMEYDNADILIVPSIWEEPFGRIVIEAAQYGTFVLGSNRGGIPETINSLKFGECFEPTKKGELCSLIEYYSNRDVLKTHLCKGPQNLNKYSLEAQIKSYLELYQKIYKQKII